MTQQQYGPEQGHGREPSPGQEHGHDHGDDHDHSHGHGQAHGTVDEVALAEVLDLDAEVLGSYLDQATAWAAEHVSQAPARIVDLGAGTGVGTVALARRFDLAEVVAVDRSALMLQRVEAATRHLDRPGSVRLVQADLDQGWPDQAGRAGRAGSGPAERGPAGVDLVWASSSLHEVAEPARVFADAYAALNPGGIMVVVEMDALPAFLPDDVGVGRPGLEARCHQALTEAGWNAQLDWRSHLEQAGFEIAAERRFATEVTPPPHIGSRYAQLWLARVRSGVKDRLAADDLAALDTLLADRSSEAVLRSCRQTVRGSRIAWIARRRP